LSFNDLHQYAVTKYTNKMIHSENGHYIKDQLISTRRGRNLDSDKLAPLNVNLGRFSLTQHSLLYYSNTYYNALPPNLTRIDDPNMFRGWEKKYYHNKSIQIPIRPRKNPITQPYQIEYDEPCYPLD